MAIGRLSLAAAALIVLAFGGSAARHPGEYCRCVNTSTLFQTSLCYLVCEAEKISLCVLGFRISDTGSLVQRSRLLTYNIVLMLCSFTPASELSEIGIGML